MTYLEHELYLILGRHLRAARESAGLTLAEAAQKLNLTLATVQRYEKAERKVTIETIRNLCHAYNVDADSLMSKCIHEFHADYSFDTPSAAKPASPTEAGLLKDFRQLNKEGQDVVCKTASGLVASGQYIKTESGTRVG